MGVGAEGGVGAGVVVGAWRRPSTYLLLLGFADDLLCERSQTENKHGTRGGRSVSEQGSERRRP